MQALKRTKNKKSKLGFRRYPLDQHPIYDQTYDLKLKRSPILNAEMRKYDIRNAGLMFDENQCKISLAQLEGNPSKDGHYLEDGKWKVAMLPSAKNHLQEIYKQFKRWQNRQVSEGFALAKPSKWPDDLLEKRLKAEAILDIYKREKLTIKSALKAYKNEKEKRRKKEILVYGPQGKGLNYDQNSPHPWIIDGQKVSKNENGIPYIDEPDSKYHLMPLMYYRIMASEWRKYQIEKSGRRQWRKMKASLDEIPSWPKEAKPINEINTE